LLCHIIVIPQKQGFSQYMRLFNKVRGLLPFFIKALLKFNVDHSIIVGGKPIIYGLPFSSIGETAVEYYLIIFITIYIGVKDFFSRSNDK